VMAGLSALSLILAALTWRFVEQPFRRRPVPLLPRRAALFAVSAAGLGLFFAVGMSGYLMDGAPGRTAPNGQTWAELELNPRLAGNPGLSRDCSDDVDRATHSPLCRTNADPKVLLWGDSHAMHLAKGILADDNARGRGFIQITKSKCAPILNLSQNNWAGGYGARCAEFNDAVLDWLRSDPGIEIVVMSSPYNILGRSVYDRDGREMNNEENTYTLKQMGQTASELRQLGIRPIFVSSPPNNGSDIGQCLTFAAARGFALDTCDFTPGDYTDWLKDSYALLERLSEHEDVVFLSDLLCSQGRCKTNMGDVFLYRDTNHLSKEGTEALGRVGLFDFVLTGCRGCMEKAQ